MKPGQLARMAAVILAAGYSSRLPGWKPGLPLGDTTVAAQAAALFVQAGVADIVVVTGHRSAELSRLLSDQPVRCIFNAHYERGMYESVITGVRALPPATSAFFLLPVDVPLVKSRTLRRLARRFAAGGSKIIYPVFQGERGHPPLISAELIPAIMAGDGNGGLRELLARHEADAADAAVLDEGILLDMDEPADYTRLQERWWQRDIPAPAECSAILEWARTDRRAVSHAQQVAAQAMCLAEAINEEGGIRLNKPLLTAACLLHDLAKGRQQHARIGGKILRVLGYPQVADLVERHMDMDFDPADKPDEAALLFLADKLILRDRKVSLTERFALALRRFNGDEPALAAAQKRLETARQIAAAVGRISGRQMEKDVEGSWRQE